MVAGSDLVRWGNSLYASPDGLGPAADGAETAVAAALRRTRRPPRLAALTDYALVLDYLLTIQLYERGHTPPDDVRKDDPCALMVEWSGNASWRRYGKRRGWQGSARTYNRSAGSP